MQDVNVELNVGSGKECSNCGGTVAAGRKTCHNCGSSFAALTVDERITALEAAVVSLAANDLLTFVGDLPGHPFRGNQYSDGPGG